MSAYSNDAGAVSVSSRPYSGSAAAQDFRDELTPSRCVSAHSLVLSSGKHLSIPARTRCASGKSGVDCSEKQRPAATCRGAASAVGKQGFGQVIVDYAKGFIEDKLKRPSAEDLLDAEDVKLLPKVSPWSAVLMRACRLT